MKKLLAVALAVVMMLAVCVPAFAADITTDGGTGTAIIKTSTQTAGGEDGAGFTVTIPAENTIYWDAQSTSLEYTVTSQLGPNTGVQVTVDDTDKAYVMTDENDYTLAYTLADTTGTTTSPVVNAQSFAYTVNVAEAAWNAAVVSEYADELTFTAELVAI